MKNNWFQAAKKAAKQNIQDVSAAHRAAGEVVRANVQGKSEEFYGELAWAAVMAAR